MDSSNGDPSPEGVHQDSAELVCLMLLHRENCRFDSGGNRLWRLEQASGKPDPEALDEGSKSNLLFETVMRDRFDAIFLLDRRLKHEGRPIVPE